MFSLGAFNGYRNYILPRRSTPWCDCSSASKAVSCTSAGQAALREHLVGTTSPRPQVTLQSSATPRPGWGSPARGAAHASENRVGQHRPRTSSERCRVQPAAEAAPRRGQKSGWLPLCFPAAAFTPTPKVWGFLWPPRKQISRQHHGADCDCHSDWSHGPQSSPADWWEVSLRCCTDCQKEKMLKSSICPLGFKYYLDTVGYQSTIRRGPQLNFFPALGVQSSPLLQPDLCCS